MNNFDDLDTNIILATDKDLEEADGIIPIYDFIDDVSDSNEKFDTLPLLPLRNTVLFPNVIIPISVGREKSLNLIEDVQKSKSKYIGVVTQMNGDDIRPAYIDLYKVGTMARILKVLKMPDNSITLIIQGKSKFLLEGLVQSEPFFVSKVSFMDPPKNMDDNNELLAIIPTIKSLAIQVIEKTPNIPNESTLALKNIDSPEFIINYVCNYLDIPVSKKQELLEKNDYVEVANILVDLLTESLKMLEVKNQIERKVKVDIDKQQREYILNQQLKTIQEELGGSPNTQDIEELKEKAKNKKWNDNVKETFEKELAKLQRMNPMVAEYSIQKNYLDTLVGLPWNEYTKDDFSQDRAKKVLDSDHYGLENVKERILEYLAVLKLKNDMKSPILCLVGPPGVGKTSLGKSIAKAIFRKYVRMSLGGLRDEAEIRGHRKTYIGAMPGRIIQSILKAKSSNPVFILDEIDKVGGMSVNGDPSAALLELLDPEQNSTFYDNFLEIEYDLSRVLFIATANSLSNVHPALRDRMEIIDINGYLLEEKKEIAKRHLIPKQLKEHGLTKKDVTFTDEALDLIINNYTRESGVRNLEKKIAAIIRNRAKLVANDKKYTKKTSPKIVKEILGHPKIIRESALPQPSVGVATGLAWTAVGGEILFIEATSSPGEGKLTMTGNLGDVMKESATLAFEYIKSHAKEFGIDYEDIKNKNVHIHVPEGDTPKDGPSAGITIFTAILSVFTNKKIDNQLAMTSEITLRGQLLPVGGIKEKILAAKRANISNILLCLDNKGDIAEIKKEYIDGLNFIYAKNMNEVPKIAFVNN